MIDMRELLKDYIAELKSKTNMNEQKKNDSADDWMLDREGGNIMGRNVNVTYICDRCGKEITSQTGDYGLEWFKLFTNTMKLMHDKPRWNRTENFLLCEDCEKAFNKWMEEGKNEQSNA